MSFSSTSDYLQGLHALVSTKLGSMADKLEGMDAIQRGMDRLGDWNSANRMNFSKAKYNILHLGCSRHRCRLSGGRIEGSLEVNDLDVLVGEKDLAMCTCIPENQPYLRLYQKKYSSQMEKSNSLILLCFYAGPSALGSPIQEWCAAAGASPEEGYRETPEIPFLRRHGLENSGCSVYGREDFREALYWPSST